MVTTVQQTKLMTHGRVSHCALPWTMGTANDNTDEILCRVDGCIKFRQTKARGSCGRLDDRSVLDLHHHRRPHRY